MRSGIKIESSLIFCKLNISYNWLFKYRHAFGNYTGPSEYDIQDQVCMMREKFGEWKKDKRNSAPQNDGIGSINYNSNDLSKPESNGK